MSSKIGISTKWVEYYSIFLNGISYAYFITDRAVSVEIRNGGTSWWSKLHQQTVGSEVLMGMKNDKDPCANHL